MSARNLTIGISGLLAMRATRSSRGAGYLGAQFLCCDNLALGVSLHQLDFAFQREAIVHLNLGLISFHPAHWQKEVWLKNAFMHGFVHAHVMQS